MSVLEMFSRVSVKSPIMQPTARGVAQITNEDIVGTLKGVSWFASHWVYFHHMGDRSLEAPIINELKKRALIFNQSEKLKLNADTICGLVSAVIDELALPVCLECNGSGMDADYYKATKLDIKISKAMLPHHTCSACSGTGHRQLKKSQISRYAGIKPQSYSDSHRRVMSYVHSVIGDAEQEVIHSVKSKLIVA